MSDLVNRIRRYQAAYRETGLIGVYDHVLLNDLGAAADKLEQASARIDNLHEIASKAERERDTYIDGVRELLTEWNRLDDREKNRRLLEVHQAAAIAGRKTT